MTQQVLSGFEIQELSKIIAESSKKTDSSLESVIEEALNNYILIPKHTSIPTPTPKA